MSMVVTIANDANLKKAKSLLNAKTESEAIEIALEIVIRDFEERQKHSELPENFFEDLFAEKTKLADGESIHAITNERETIESVFDLNYVKPKRSYEIQAEFEFIGRGKPLPFDFSEIDFEEEN